MARRDNDLFIGKQYLNTEGRAIKHPGLLKRYASLNVNKIDESRIELVGLDLETDNNTAELKLLGHYDGNRYAHYDKEVDGVDFMGVLVSLIKYAKRHEKRIAYWNRLDPFILMKQFFPYVSQNERYRALQRFGKIAGEWNRKEGKWDVRPVIEIMMGDLHVGIKNAIRSNVQFYFYRHGQTDNGIKTVWAYDIAQLYKSGLEEEAKSRLDYYSKVHQSAHIVDWKRYKTDEDYRENIVLKSNELDARACYDLGIIMQEDFKEAFGYYPRTLISQGSLARSAIIATLKNEASKEYENPEENKALIEKEVTERAKTIGIIKHYDDWLKTHDEDIVKDAYCLATETYSGGRIEALGYGKVKEAFTADLATAYPATISKLWDLTGSKITRGEGEPPDIDYSYCLIRGDVSIPHYINSHPITVKHTTHKETNIQGVGDYRASYFKEERDYLITLGATFQNETWINIETKGELSPLAKVCEIFVNLRNRLTKEGKSSAHMAKIASNSIYGLLLEAIMTYIEQFDDFGKASAKRIVDDLRDNVFPRDKYDVEVKNRTHLEHLVIEANKNRNYDDIKTHILNETKVTPLDAYSNDIKAILKYKKRIKLGGIKDDIKYLHGHLRYYSLFNNKSGIEMEDVREELFRQGVIIDGYTDVDIFDNMCTMYKASKGQSLTLYDIPFKEREALIHDTISTLDKQYDAFDGYEVIDEGFQGGEFWNPVYGAFTTMMTRLKIAKASNVIEEKGGKVILQMTDAIFWEGNVDMIPQEMVREVKTMGYYEKPKTIHNLVVLGSGRYSYEETTKEGVVRLTAKRRGLKTVEVHDAKGIVVDDFDWLRQLEVMQERQSTKIDIKVRVLISPGIILHNHRYDWMDLGKLVDDVRHVDCIVGKAKRIVPVEADDPNALAKGMIYTKSLYLSPDMQGNVQDQTLPLLREQVMKKSAKSTQAKKRKSWHKASKKYHERNRDAINEKVNNNYQQLIAHGYDSPTAHKMAKWGIVKLKNALMTDNKI